MDQQGTYVPIDMLIVCTHPLYDVRISELRNENMELRLKLFWAIHTKHKLVNLIQQHGHIVNCGCLACHVGQRTSSEEIETVCRWQPLFESIIAECDLTWSVGGPTTENFHG